MNFFDVVKSFVPAKLKETSDNKYAFKNLIISLTQDESVGPDDTDDLFRLSVNFKGVNAQAFGPHIRLNFQFFQETAEVEISSTVSNHFQPGYTNLATIPLYNPRAMNNVRVLTEKWITKVADNSDKLVKKLKVIEKAGFILRPTGKGLLAFYKDSDSVLDYLREKSKDIALQMREPTEAERQAVKTLLTVCPLRTALYKDDHSYSVSHVAVFDGRMNTFMLRVYKTQPAFANALRHRYLSCFTQIYKTYNSTVKFVESPQYSHNEGHYT